MWLLLTFLLLARTIAADYEHGWKTGNEYTYLVQSRTLTGLEALSEQMTGIITKCWLVIQPTDTNTLLAQLSNCKYAHIHKVLPEGWDVDLSKLKYLQLNDLPVSEKTFEIKLKHGVIKDLIVDRAVPTWEVNIVKSAVSQLQVDSQGENSVKTEETQIPTDENPHGSFKAMEDSVGGRCEVRYDITPLSMRALHMRRDLQLLPELKDGPYIEIVKTRNFNRCAQRVNYHFGITGNTNWEPGSNRNGEFLTRSSTSRIVISGTLKSFTIQSSVTTSKIEVSPRLYDHKNGLVASVVNLSLGSMKKISNPMSRPNSPESIGNLVYLYNNPFSNTEERRVAKVENSNHIWNSDSISSVSSSEEMPKKGENLRSFDSSSSSGSSSSISSSEENDFWQPKPTLEEAPQNPLLPNFIGFNGKFIGLSGEVDVVKATTELVSEMANELEDPNNIPSQETLEKFTILCSLIRTMNRDQLSQVDAKMQLSPNELKWNDKSQTNKQNNWAVYRDAVVQAGTGPAFLTIKNWITKGHVGSLEAADIFGRIAKNVRTPTTEYVRAFFDLITSPKIKNDPLVEPTAMLAFGDLIRYSHVHGKSIHNRYPVHAFGRMVSKHDQTVQNEYIPYLGRELKKAIENDDSVKTQTYIMALGQMGHPKMLSVFEPYLEGQHKVTTFQRTLMILSMGSLSETNPKLLRSVLYKVYLNTMESHEVRCSAVFLLMSTDPPLSMLQRMAEFTRYDTDKQVNSAVKSSLMSMAEVTNPQWQERAKKARSVLSLLTPDDYSYELSHRFVVDTVKENQNSISTMIFDYIGSDESVIPRALYFGLFHSHGGYNMPPSEFAAMLSSFKNLVDIGFAKGGKEEIVKMAAEKIAEELSIVPEEPIPLEGILMWNTKYRSRLFPFDSASMRGTCMWIAKQIAAQKEESYVNLNKLFSYDMTLAFPTETGLPFVYTLRVPILYKFSGTSKLQMDLTGTTAVKSSFRLVYSQKIQGRIGFVAPFHHQHFLAGVDANFQAYIPMKLALDVDVPKTTVQLKIWPLKGEENAQLIHYSVLPYTSQHDILSLRPVMMDKNTHVIKPDHINSVTFPTTKDGYVKVLVEANKFDNEFWDLDLDKIAERLESPWTTDHDRYCKIDVYANINREEKENEPWIFTVVYDTLTVEPKPDAAQDWSRQAKAVEPSNKEPNSDDRRKQFLREVARGIKLAKSEVLDIQFQLPDKWKASNALTLAWSTSTAEKKGRSLIYWRLNTDTDSNFEVCAASQTSSWPETTRFFDQMTRTNPKTEFNVNLRYGTSCSSGEQVNLKGVAEQSEELRKTIKETPEAIECQKQMKQGNKILRACQNAVTLATMVDEVDVSVDFGSQSTADMFQKVIDLLGNSNYLDTDTDTLKPKNMGKKKIDIKTKLSKDLSTIDLTIHSPTSTVHVNDIDLSPLGIDAEELLGTADDDLDLKVYEDQAACMLDKTRIETFDGKDYPLRLGNCWHVVLTTYPKLNPDKPTEKVHIPEENSLSILTRETMDGHKEVKVLLGDNEIKLMPTSLQPKVYVNGKTIEISDTMSYQEKSKDDILFEIFKLGDHSIGMVAQKYEVSMAFDGMRLLIQASNTYRESIRGLCGNFDGKGDNDFLGPKNCLMRDPELFTASYALTKNECEGVSLDKAKSIQSHDCIPYVTDRQSNVISDAESGRTDTEHGTWGYHHGANAGERRCSAHKTHVHETGDKICFTVRPVLVCAPGCAATEMKSKNYQLHCMERTEAALSLKKRIEKGARPDLSQKSISMSQRINVPLACKVA